MEMLEKYGISRYEFLMQAGFGYIVAEKDGRLSRKILYGLAERDYAGLWITRTQPEKAGLPPLLTGHVELKWVSDTASGDYVIPPKPEYVKREVERFLDKNPDARCVVLLDCLEYLITHGEDSFQSTLTLMNILSDIITVKNAILVVPLNPGAISSERYALLGRTLSVFSPPHTTNRSRKRIF
jgi:hypothetical protein